MSRPTARHSSVTSCLDGEPLAILVDQLIGVATDTAQQSGTVAKAFERCPVTHGFDPITGDRDGVVRIGVVRNAVWPEPLGMLHRERRYRGPATHSCPPGDMKRPRSANCRPRDSASWLSEAW